MKYASSWFDANLNSKSELEIAQEKKFLQALLGAAPKRILDMCSGEGFHARLFAEMGHKVFGVDVDPFVVSRARQSSQHWGKSVEYFVEDMRSLPVEIADLDAIFFLYQCFGYYGASEDMGIINNCLNKFRSSQSFLLLDLYNPLYFAVRPCAEPKYLPANVRNREVRYSDNILTITSIYLSGEVESLRWHLYQTKDWQDFSRKNNCHARFFENDTEVKNISEKYSTYKILLTKQTIA